MFYPCWYKYKSHLENITKLWSKTDILHIVKQSQLGKDETGDPGRKLDWYAVLT